MDPPTSHVMTNLVEDIEVVEGPFDVENFGTLSGAVKVRTKDPEEGFHGDLYMNTGSWGYRKMGATLSGGNDKIRVLVSASKEKSKQYEDGDGNTFAEQIKEYAPAMTGVHYKNADEDMDAYDKRTFMAKLFFNPTDDQILKLSYTANRSDDVLYPSSKMDAIYDDSDILNLDYSIRNLGSFSKRLDVQAYRSYVEHPMSNLYRNSSGPNGVNEIISKLSSEIRGLKIKNTMDLDSSSELTVGVDLSRRNWDGEYIGKGTNAAKDGLVSIPDVDTDNRALFLELNREIGDFDLKIGMRYDDTSVEPSSSGLRSNDYTAFSTFLYGNYALNGSTDLFGGIGRANRVPDARELYFTNSMGNMVGTPDLDQTTNVEIDFGVKKQLDSLSLKAKVFHSWLSDYIAYNSSKAMMGSAFENVDARVYGFQISGTYFATDDIYLDFSLSAQRGKKDSPLTGQSDRDLAEIPPLKANLALNYDYAPGSSARAELIAASGWDDFDEDNGEQHLGGYGVVNLKVDHRLTDNISVTGGIENLFDRTYAVSNTYQDLTLITAGSEVMLMNEPGRYFYLNLNYNF
jgi:iron complex outermembrane receptor protein